MELSACFSAEISALAMGSEGALRNGGSDRGLRQRRGSTAEIDQAAMVCWQLCRMSEANIDTKKSLEKRFLVSVICVILIDSFFWGFVAKI